MNIRRIMKLALVMIIAVGMMGAAASPVCATAKTPSQVKGLEATQATATVISISWKKASNAKKYEVQYKAKSAKKWSSKNVSSLKTSFKGLKQNTKYQFKVRGLNGSKKGKFSSTLTQQTYLAPAAVDSKTIYAIEKSKKEIRLGWSKAKNASWYEITTRKLNSSSVDSQTSDYDSDNKTLTEFTSRIQMRPNTWYEFKVRTVNAKTGKFPALKSAWSKPYYACTTTGDRVITGEPDGNVFKYVMNNTFIVGVDESLVPEGVYQIPDPSDPYYDSDYMEVEGIVLPENFNEMRTDDTNTDEELDGKTYCVGDAFEEYTIQKIIITPDYSDEGANGGFAVTFVLSDAYKPTFSW